MTIRLGEPSAARASGNFLTDPNVASVTIVATYLSEPNTVTTQPLQKIYNADHVLVAWGAALDLPDIGLTGFNAAAYNASNAELYIGGTSYSVGYSNNQVNIVMGIAD